jgi:uncharacterized membrane protein YphA (DoxX/SURF4 family)
MADNEQTIAGTSGSTTNEGGARPGRQWLPAIARVLLGFAFLIFGLNGFLNFIPAPKDIPPEIMNVMGALMKGGWMTVVSGVEVVAALMLLTNRFVPLGLVLLAPVIVGIITFHVAMQPKGIGPGIVVLVIELYLAWAYRGAFCPMLAAKTSPGPIPAERRY